MSEEIGCAALAGVLATAVTHPLDTAAVFRQTGRALPVSIGLYYRGPGPACIQGALIYGAILGGYEVLRGIGWNLIPAAAASALPESLVRGPLDALKNLRQTGLG